MTISQTQAMGISGTASGSSISRAMTSVPTAGNILVVTGGVQLVGQSLTISDDMTDGGLWTLVQGPITFAATMSYSTWFKQVGGTANSNKTITVSQGTSGVGLTIDTGEWHSDTGTTWALDGSATNATGISGTANGGNVTVSASPGLIVVKFASNGGAPTAGTSASYTRDYQSGAFVFREAAEWATPNSGTYATDWTNGVGDTWEVLGAAFKITTAGGSASRIRFPAQLSGMGVGGQLGGNRIN